MITNSKTNQRNSKVKAILFDLDGTLLDTAPDFVYAMNLLLKKNNKPEISLRELQPFVAYGSVAMVKHAFNIEENHNQFVALRDEFLTIYSNNISRFTQPFTGIREVLVEIAKINLMWGVVTNKPGWLTDPLLEAMAISPPPHCVISGDTLPYRKPHPLPLIHASQTLGCAPDECIFIGDAEIDVLAAKQAGMPAIIVKYGYLTEQDEFMQWQADAYIERPEEIIGFVGVHPTI